ncbi:uncharacterized protein LOC144823540 isoform X2 [Lissotriton helveticus]
MSVQELKEVSFHEAPSCFSEEEWKLLQEWQKELYGNVMKEIHHALISLGPLITTTVSSLRAKEKQKQCSMDIPKSNRRHSITRSQSDPITNLDACFIINTEQHVPPKNLQDTGGQGTGDCRGDPMTSPDECFIVKDEVLNNSQDKKEREKRDCLSEGHDIISFSLPAKEEPTCMNHGNNTKEESSVSLSGHDIISFSLPDKKEPTCMNHGNNTKEESSVSLSGHDNIQLHIADTEKISCNDHGNNGRKESVVSPTEHGIISFSIKEEEVSYCMDPENNTEMESIHSPAAVPVITAVFSLSTKLEEEMCAQKIQSEKKASGELSDTGRVFERVPSACFKSKKTFPRESTRVNYQLVHTREARTSFMDRKKTKKQSENCTQQKPFSCSDCKKSFSRKSVLELHQTIHSGEKPFPCNDCEKSFTRKISLKRHMLIHTGDNPFPCTDCNKTFLYKSELLRHQVYHTGEKPYVCTVCGKGFFQKRLLVQHQIIHIQVQPTVPEEAYSNDPSSTSPEIHLKDGVETPSLHYF